MEKTSVQPDDIAVMFQSHTHFSHIGGLSDFPNSRIVIAKAERALPKPLYWRETQPVEWPDQTYVLITEDTENEPRFDVLFVAGHVPGQLARLIDLPETGRVLLIPNAISRPAEIVENLQVPGIRRFPDNTAPGL